MIKKIGSPEKILKVVKDEKDMDTNKVSNSFITEEKRKCLKKKN